jgi:UDPglucose 6-dehydrogenase
LAVELCDWLLNQGAKVRAYDPAVKQLPEHWAGSVSHCTTALDAVVNADVLVVGTEWPEFKQVASDLLTVARPGLVVVDANRHLQAQVLQSGFNYVAVGTPLAVWGK